MKELLKTFIIAFILAIIFLNTTSRPEISAEIKYNGKPFKTPVVGLGRMESVRMVYPATEIKKKDIVSKKGSGVDYWNNVIDQMGATEDEKDWLKRIMKCESHGNEYATNWQGSGASGLMQFMPATYKGNGGKDIWNGYEQLEIALKMFRYGQSYQWACD